jgi:hypothetical protein
MEKLRDSERNRSENQDLEQRIHTILSSTTISPRQRVQMACSLGAILELFGEQMPAFSDLEPGELAELARDTVAALITERPRSTRRSQR